MPTIISQLLQALISEMKLYQFNHNLISNTILHYNFQTMISLQELESGDSFNIDLQDLETSNPQLSLQRSFQAFPGEQNLTEAQRKMVSPSETAIETSCLKIYSEINSRPYNLDYFDYKITPQFILLGLYDAHQSPEIGFYLKSHLLNKIQQLLRNQMIRNDQIYNTGHFMTVFSQEDSEGFFETEKNVALILKKAFAQVQTQVQTLPGGSTAAVALLIGNKVWTAHVGDTAIYSSVSQPIQLEKMSNLELLTPLHNLSSPREYNKIQTKGGNILHRGGVHRLQGIMALSRSIGDFQFKPIMDSEPQISFYQKNQKKGKIVLATDGWGRKYGDNATIIIFG